MLGGSILNNTTEDWTMPKEYLVTEPPLYPPAHPGELLKNTVMPALCLSVSEAARQMRVSRQTLHRIMGGTHPVTPDMAVRLGHFCGNGAQLWLTMQQNYDLWHAEARLGDELKQIPKHAA